MRSILFLPLDKIERVPKALASNSDKVIFDLEDGLAKDKKDFGRENFIEFSKSNFDNQPEKSPYKCIEQLPAANWLRFKNGRIQTGVYWKLEDLHY